MSNSELIFYDLNRCADIVAQQNVELADTVDGIEKWAALRPLYYDFAYEAFEQARLVLAQVDPQVVLAFAPWNLPDDVAQRAVDLVRQKGAQLFASKGPHLVYDLADVHHAPMPLDPRARLESWVREDFLDEMLLPRRVSISMLFDLCSFHNVTMRTELEKRGFRFISNFKEMLSTEMLRVTHPKTPRTIYKIPWGVWAREMFSGGFTIVYLIACFAIYLQKLDSAIDGNATQ